MKPLSREWTAEDRLRVVAALLPQMQEDIYAGRYSAPGRPNVVSLQHVMHDPADALEEYRTEMESLVKEHEQERTSPGESEANRSPQA